MNQEKQTSSEERFEEFWEKVDSVSVKGTVRQSWQEQDAFYQPLLAAKDARIKELEAALKPFAKFACDEPHVNEPECHNCKAKSALNRE